MNKKAKRLSTLSPRFEEFIIVLQKLMLVLAILFSVSVLSAYNLYVDASADSLGADGSFNNPYPKIQKAIAHAFDDDLEANMYTSSVEIILFDCASGYNETLTVNFKNEYDVHRISDLTIRSLSNNPEACHIVGADESSPVFTINGRESSKLRIKGLTIRHPENNFQETGNYAYNGIYFEETNSYGTFNTFDVTNCVFDHVSKAIRNDSSMCITSMNIRDCTFHLRWHWGTSVWAIYSIVTGTYADTSLFFKGNTVIGNNPLPAGRIIALHISQWIENFEVSDNYFENADVWKNGTEFICNTIIENNVFKNSRVYLENRGTSFIKHNKFSGLQGQYDLCALALVQTSRDSTNLCLVENNIFLNCRSAIEISYVYLEWRLTAELNNNSFIMCNGALKMQRHSNMGQYSNSVSSYRNNLWFSLSEAPFYFCDENNNEIELTGDRRIPVSYSLFWSPPSTTTSLLIDPFTVLYSNPLIDYDEADCSYTMLWDQYQKSPLINAGCPEIDGIVQTDPDGTRPDIGAVYYKHNHREYDFNRVNQSGIHWKSFPVIDDRSQTDDHYWNETGMFFGQYMTGAPYEHRLETVAWSYATGSGNMSYENQEWTQQEVPITQPKGFKIQLRNIGQGWVPPLLVDGFKANPVNTPIELTRVDANNADFPNWIGYFVPYTQSVESAFSKPVPRDPGRTYLDYIYWIKTQSWGTSRTGGNAGGDWIISPDLLTLSEGDMVEVKLLKDITFDLNEMYWHAFGAVKEPYVRPTPEGFNFTELLDYTPIFIEFDPENTPDEVGVFVGNKCYGAAAVDDNIIEVNLYYQADDAKSDDEISFMFYYADKSLKKAPAPLVYNPDTLLFETGTLKAGQIKDFGYVSYLKGEGGTMAPLLTQLNTNYPNPFRDKTNISYILEKEAKISVEIYNLKGQKVKTLYSGMGKKGKHGISWDSTDNHGKKVASGVYFCRLITPDSIQSQKMLLMK
ncbi:MAG: T9SS type A sorting domain-containing protein [Candidatus Cloacimonetes bacterium]|nr:T9SS type A sorting domain-containing protein [Candidatus Cloacimonadota bacterium]